MDLQSFIRSGKLEAYALGLDTVGERAETERLLAEHPLLRTELEAIEQTLENYAQVKALSPPPGLKERILSNLDEPEADPILEEPAPVVPKAKKPVAWILAAAILTFALAAAIFMYSNLLQSRNQLELDKTMLQKQVEDCLQNTRVQQQAQEQIAQQVELLRDRSTKSIVLTNKNSDASAQVFVNGPKQQVALDLKSLPVVPDNQYYQFWAIVDGQPVSMGMVDREGEWQFLRLLPGTQAVAISVEPTPQGSTAPTSVFLAGGLGEPRPSRRRTG